MGWEGAVSVSIVPAGSGNRDQQVSESAGRGLGTIGIASKHRNGMANWPFRFYAQLFEAFLLDCDAD
jgi:hypothetical protein